VNSYVGKGIFGVGNLALSGKGESLSTHHVDILGSGTTAPRILNVDIGCRCVIFLPVAALRVPVVLEFRCTPEL